LRDWASLLSLPRVFHPHGIGDGIVHIPYIV
jgi:hypothetical protein